MNEPDLFTLIIQCIFYFLFIYFIWISTKYLILEINNSPSNFL